MITILAMGIVIWGIALVFCLHLFAMIKDGFNDKQAIDKMECFVLICFFSGLILIVVCGLIIPLYQNLLH